MTDPAGWHSDFPTFRDTAPNVVRERLQQFLNDASVEQVRAWTDSIPPLQREVGEVLTEDGRAVQYAAILEYRLPMESRRPDVVLLLGAAVMVLELKGKLHATQADLDQAAAYARDLRCYHRECHGRPVIPVLVPTRARGFVGEDNGVHVVGPDVLDEMIRRYAAEEPKPLIARERFLDEGAYAPLPTLVQAARELFDRGELRTIHRARAATDPAVNVISELAHRAAADGTRHLVLVTGVPGAGKTLVGLRAVHSKRLDDLAVERTHGKPAVPAVFLSGNGPLVQVLQYQLRGAGGGGKTFVRAMKDFLDRYIGRPERVPDEHVLVFDEAQRAFDVEQMRFKHESATVGSEPQEVVAIADRIPQWAMVVGLVGTGQEIHVGEEGGVEQWLEAVRHAPDPSRWTIHAPPVLAERFAGKGVRVEVDAALNLDTELRFHLATRLHEYVARLLAPDFDAGCTTLARHLEIEGYHLRLTRSLDVAKAYLRERYANAPEKRFGLVASSKDKLLPRFGVPNDFNATKGVKVGPWYADDEDAYGSKSCRLLRECVTEFGAQGLELDAALLAWGTDFMREGGRWTNRLAGGYQRKTAVRDAFQLRLNAYRVLLTRGRDATVIFVPPVHELDETFAHLRDCGIRELTSTPAE